MVICTFVQPLIVVLKVSGLFSEQGSNVNEEDLLLGFSRTFVLKKVADRVVCSASCNRSHSSLISHQFQGFFEHSAQYVIINEMVFIHRPSVFQTKNSFRLVANMDVDDVSMFNFSLLSYRFHLFRGVYSRKKRMEWSQCSRN